MKSGKIEVTADEGLIIIYHNGVQVLAEQLPMGLNGLLLQLMN